MTLFGVDVASYQGKPNWSKVYASGIRYAFSKVTENTHYVNPTWSHNRSGMLALGDDFLPGTYHFLHGGSGAAQARYFLEHAGDVSRFAVALDVEASGANAATARDWVREFKDRTGGHPVIGYFPRWYWEQQGRPDLSFFDTIWQSHYVSGSGSPASLYKGVPGSWWSPFGGEPISILQFSSSATVPGISGRCDVNAFRGTLAELRAIALGGDMAISKDDLKAITKAVWTTDGIIEAPPEKVAEGNSHWQASSYLHWSYRHITDIQARVRALESALAGLSVNVDAEAVAARVLESLTPEAIAAAIPADMAARVVDELARRLGD